jgi:tetratricopeptide (TPR) repeat protein
MWLKRFIERVTGPDEPAQAAQVGAVLDRRGVFENDQALLDGLLEVLDAPLEDAALARVARALRVRPAGDVEIDPGDQLDFWTALARRHPANPYVHACLGDALLAAGRSDEALLPLLEAIELEPSLVAEFGDDLAPLAGRAGGLEHLRYQLADLRARLDDPDEAEEVRERYSEMLEDYRGNEPAMARIRALGAVINQLAAAGKLPRAFVRRTR